MKTLALDNNFLEEAGLGSMPEELKKSFLQFVYSKLEIRVGEQLTEEMRDEELEEFGYFVDKNADKMLEWLLANVPDFEGTQIFQKIEKETPDIVTALSEYGSMMWLQKMRPEYPQIVAAALEELKMEIREKSESILSAYTKG